MRKKYIILFAIFIFLFILVLTSIIYGYEKSKKHYGYKKQDTINKVNEVVVQTASNDGIKISPNAKVHQKQFYKKCGHTVEEIFSAPEQIINKNKAEVEKYYYGWKIEQISNKEIFLYKENYGICQEHYVVKDLDGTLMVYKKNENDDEELYLRTQINSKYLPEDDYNRLKNGICIIGKENLYSLLEDYE